jgi:hypothetical protein
MERLFAEILSAKKKGWFRSQPLFKQHKVASEAELTQLEYRLGIVLPTALRKWFLGAGHGAIGDELHIHECWFRVIDRGPLQGHIIFAQDQLGNFYSYAQPDGAVHFISRSTPEYAFIAKDFASFLEELWRRGVRLEEWTDSLETLPYDWGN